MVVFYTDLDADTAEFPLGFDLHFLIHFGSHISGMRVQRRQHAPDGSLDEILRLRLIHIMSLNLIQDFGKGLEFLVRFTGVACWLPALADEEPTEKRERNHRPDYPRLSPRLLFHHHLIPSFNKDTPPHMRGSSPRQPLKRIHWLVPFAQFKV